MIDHKSIRSHQRSYKIPLLRKTITLSLHAFTSIGMTERRGKNLLIKAFYPNKPIHRHLDRSGEVLQTVAPNDCKGTQMVDSKNVHSQHSSHKIPLLRKIITLSLHAFTSIGMTERRGKTYEQKPYTKPIHRHLDRSGEVLQAVAPNDYKGTQMIDHKSIRSQHSSYEIPLLSKIITLSLHTFAQIGMTVLKRDVAGYFTIFFFL